MHTSGSVRRRDTITYRYDIDGHAVALTRRHWYTAYARNGNVGNPTENYLWDAHVDGELVQRGCALRSDAYEHARCHIAGVPYCNDQRRPERTRNVRNYLLVKAEMAANYRGRVRDRA
ncbi:MAG TPA: hypothetical protein VHD87_12890 [Acidimicrobiales bacterium]|nr:hypothetical protein [Acidimicrobiales bacterium]